MKKIFTLLSLLPLTSVAFGQITINSTDMPTPTGDYNIMNIGTPTNPIVGTNILWNYGANTGGADIESYTVETDPVFTGVGIDVYYPSAKSMAPGFTYNLNMELDFNTSNVKEAGAMIPYQLFDLSTVTGNTGDSLSFPLQKNIFGSPSEVVHFPFTANTSWHSENRRSTNFFLTVTPFYNNTPGQHVYYSHRDDTIVGWGKMRVYATSGPSADYDVLMDKIAEYSIDSIYLSGSPAPATFLSSFGVVQGQHSDSAFYYNFYRKGSYNYLMEFYYDIDPTYTTSTNVYAATDNISPSGISNISSALYSTVLFPNPSANNEVNLQVMGKDINEAAYSITDVTGKIVQSGNAELKGKGLLHVALNDLVNGRYFIHFANDKNSFVANEQFTVAR